MSPLVEAFIPRIRKPLNPLADEFIPFHKRVILQPIPIRINRMVVPKFEKMAKEALFNRGK